MNVTIGEKRTSDDWGLKLRSMSIALPEPKTNRVDIVGADGVLDLTDALGTVRYKNRDIQFVFDAMARPEQWHSLTSEIANYLHGRRHKVILDTDPYYYYIGRLSLESGKDSYLTNQITILGDVDPYKYELYSSLEDWLWDDFDLDSGVIREYKDLAVSGSLSVTIPGTRKEVVPTIASSAAMQVEWKGVRYDLPAGETKIYEISIPEGDHTLTFHGTGTVSIDYRGGIL